jgi:hypothetical protein
LRTAETVPIDTPAFLAMSLSVAIILFSHCDLILIKRFINNVISLKTNFVNTIKAIILKKLNGYAAVSK